MIIGQTLFGNIQEIFEGLCREFKSLSELFECMSAHLYS